MGNYECKQFDEIKHTDEMMWKFTQGIQNLC